MTKSGRGPGGEIGTGTLGRGTWDSRTWPRDVGTRGHGDAETRTRCDLRTWDEGTRGLDKQTTPDFCAEFVKYNFRCSPARERYCKLGSLSSRLVANKNQRPWFGLFACLFYRESPE